MLCWLCDHNCREAKPTKRSFKGKSDGARRGDRCAFEKVVGMERLVGVKQSLRLDGRKVWRIKKAGVSQVNAIMLRLVPCRQSTSL